jgi:non-ribosomal peptide synthetase component F
MARMAGHFAALAAAVAAPGAAALDGPLEDLPLLTPAERGQILVEWTETDADYPREAALGELFAGQARLRPHAVALAFGDSALTYGEANRRANRLAHRLRALGVGPEVAVALCLERSPAMVVAILAVAKAGGFYVPLDPGPPRERLALLLAGTAAAAVVTEERFLAALPAATCPRVLLDRDAATLAGESGADPEPLAGPDNLVYVMFTSGSTGVPKGVAVPHRGVVRLVRGSRYADLGPDEVFLQLAPYAFDASTFELWGALLHGGRLAIAPPGG